VGENLNNISVYMADARTLSLPLVGGGDHDWNELFHRFGVLDEPTVRAVSGTTHAAGVALMVVSAAWLGFFVLPITLRGRVRDGLTSRWPWIGALLGA